VNVGRTRIETRIEDFPLRGSQFSTGMAKWVNEDDRMLMVFGILPPYPSPYPAYPFVRPAVPSRHRSYIDARFRGECQSVDNLFERRASNVSYLRNRARANAVRCGILDFAPFSCLTIVCPTLRDGVDLFRRCPSSRPAAMFINESQLQFRPDAHFYSGGKVTSRSRAPTTTTRIAVPVRVSRNSIKMSMSRILRAVWG